MTSTTPSPQFSSSISTASPDKPSRSRPSADAVAAPASQTSLFDAGLDLGPLEAHREAIMNSTLSEWTMKTYASRWKLWLQWCEAAGKCPFPAAPDTVVTWMTWAVKVRKLRLQTVDATLKTLKWKHREAGLPCPVDASVKELFRNCQRHLKEPRQCAKPLTPDHIRRMVATLDPEVPIDIRNNSIVLFAFAAGWRSAELLGLRMEDLEFRPEGVLVTLRFSKTDQIGKGRQVGIHYSDNPETCPVRALEKWIAVRGKDPGPLYPYYRPLEMPGRRDPIPRRLRYQIVPDRPFTFLGLRALIDKLMIAIGEDPKGYSTHSFRSGFVTAAAEAGEPEWAIMARTGHRSIGTLMRYIRPAKAFGHNPMRKVL